MKTALVTGGSGFCGSYLVRTLSERGWEVSVIDTITTEEKEVKFYKGDIRDKYLLMEAMKAIDVVFHLAARVPLTKAGRDFWSTNVDGTQTVLETALSSGVKKVLHMSSTAVYSLNPSELPITEKTSLKANTVYGRSKQEAEAVCKRFRDKGLNIIIIRPRTVIAPCRLGIIELFFDWIRKNRNVYMLGDGNNLFQFVHASDLSNACILAVEKTDNEEFNIGTDRFGTIRELFEKLIAYACSTSEIRCIPRRITQPILYLMDKINLLPLADWHYRTAFLPCYFDVSKAKDLLSWKPHYSNDEMFFESYGWYVKHTEDIYGAETKSPHTSILKRKILRILK